MKISKSDRDEAIARLREALPEGSTVYCVLRSVSRSGMSREISFHGIEIDKYEGKPELTWLSGYVSNATGYRRGKREGLHVSGCGMDMGFAVVYDLSRVLYGKGDALKHRWV